MSDTFDHYADAIDNYMEEQWDGVDPNPYMPYIGRTPREVSMSIANIVRGGSPCDDGRYYRLGADVEDGGGIPVYFYGMRDEYEPKKKKPKHVSCRHCGKEKLHWQQKDGRWRLYSKAGELHSCYSQPEPKETHIDKNLTKGNYKFIFKSDHVEDWYVVLHKGKEIGRVLHQDKWQWFGHKHVDIPEAVCQSMQRFSDTLNGTQP